MIPRGFLRLLFRLLVYASVICISPCPPAAAEPPEYLQANDNAQAHAANPTGWILPGLRTVSVPGDGNTWRLADSKVLVRAFTNPQYYNLTVKKFQNLYPAALWVTTGDELPVWYRDAGNGVNAGNIAMKTAQLHGLPTSSLAQYNAVVELWVDPNKLMRPARDPNRMAQPTALPNQDFSTKPAYMSDDEFNKFKAWYTSNITASYNDPDPNKRYPWTQLGYTYQWGGDQSTLSSVAGLSEFVILGTKAGFTSPLETFAVYSIQSYLYRTGADGDGSGNFNITGSCDTIWAGTKFQPDGNLIMISPSGIVAGGEGIYISSNGYTVINSGSITGPTRVKYYGDGPAGTSIYFHDGGTLINNASGYISGDDIAVGGRTDATSAVNVINSGYLYGNLYAVKTGAGDDSLTVENGGIVRGSVDLGTGTDRILLKTGSVYRPVIDRQNGNASVLKAADVTVQMGATVMPELTGTGLLQSGSSYRIVQGTAVTGSFMNIADNYPVFDFSLISSGTDLSLRVTRIPYANIAMSADPKIAAFAGTLDLNIGTASGDLVTLLSEIDILKDSAAVANSLRQLAPLLHTATTPAVFATDRKRFNQILEYHSAGDDISNPADTQYALYAAADSVSDAVPDGRIGSESSWDAFALASGHWGSQDAKDNIPGYDYNAWTSLAGMTKRFSRSTIAGFSLSGSQTYISSNDPGKSMAQIDTFSPAFFAGARLEKFRFDALSAYSYNQYHGDRRITFGSINRTARNDHNGHQFSGMMNIGYQIQPAKKTTIEPMAGFYLSYLREGGFSETGADSANLTVEPRWNWALRSHLGSRLRQRLHYEKTNLDLELAALWLHDFHEANDVTARLSSLGEGASVSGITPDRDAFEMRARLSLHQAKSLSLSLEYALTLSPDGREHSVNFGFRWLF